MIFKQPKIVKKSIEKSKKTPQLLRGMKDILPEEQRYWSFIRRRVEAIAKVYGFGRIDMPFLEETSLFVRSIGKETDIVEKEMYSFSDKSGDSISLRPEGTAGVVRAYLEHGMINRPQPVKLYYFGPFFRYDRPQAGRYRQFYQFGFEVLGENHPVIDAQIMMLSYNFYIEMGLPASLQVNCVGCPDCRDDYQKVLVDYYKSRKNSLCENCRLRLQRNPLRLLDCKESDCQLLMQEAPQVVDYLCEECNSFFVKVLENLDCLEIPYVLNSRLVRGLDYYFGTAFEIWLEDSDQENKQSAQNALGGGGRYNYLAEMLGGQPTPAIGYAGGVERLIIELKNHDSKVDKETSPDVFVAQLGDAAKKKSLRLFEDLRQAGFRITESFSKDSLKPQMELANERQVKYTVILGQKEIMDDTILIRDMENGIQETIDYRRIIPELEKRLKKFGAIEKNGKDGTS